MNSNALLICGAISAVAMATGFALIAVRTALRKHKTLALAKYLIRRGNAEHYNAIERAEKMLRQLDALEHTASVRAGIQGQP